MSLTSRRRVSGRKEFTSAPVREGKTGRRIARLIR